MARVPKLRPRSYMYHTIPFLPTQVRPVPHTICNYYSPSFDVSFVRYLWVMRGEDVIQDGLFSRRVVWEAADAQIKAPGAGKAAFACVM